MKNYQDLNIQERLDLYNKAFTFLHDHADPIRRLFDKKTIGIAPSGRDMFHPELWKGTHWVWFMCKDWSDINGYTDLKMSD
jgi:hypothetical protein